MASNERVVVGSIGKPFGVRGWVNVWPALEDPLVFFSFTQIFLNGAAGADSTVVFEDGRRHGKGLVVKFSGVDDRDAAAVLTGAKLSIPRGDLPEAEPGAYYWAELIGLEVETQSGKALGRVEQILPTGVHDVLVVKGVNKHHVPYVLGQVVKSVDLAGGLIVVDWDWDL